MKSGDIYICNICSLKSSDDENAVFIKAHKNGEFGFGFCHLFGQKSTENENAVFIRAHKNGEEVDICTACIPSVIHGSGMVVKSNSEIEEELQDAAN